MLQKFKIANLASFSNRSGHSGAQNSFKLIKISRIGRIHTAPPSQLHNQADAEKQNRLITEARRII
jgi:hypothetical protein